LIHVLNAEVLNEAATLLARMIAAETASIVLAELRSETQRAPAKGPLLSKQQLAQALGVSVATIDREVTRGLPCVVVGASRRFDESAARAWLETQAASRLAEPPKGSAAPVRLLSRATRKSAPKAA
jgi:predicted DNA-binding transcriptional regulator AlpA